MRAIPSRSNPLPPFPNVGPVCGLHTRQFDGEEKGGDAGTHRQKIDSCRIAGTEVQSTFDVRRLRMQNSIFRLCSHTCMKRRIYSRIVASLGRRVQARGIRMEPWGRKWLSRHLLSDGSSNSR